MALSSRAVHTRRCSCQRLTTCSGTRRQSAATARTRHHAGGGGRGRKDKTTLPPLYTKTWSATDERDGRVSYRHQQVALLNAAQSSARAWCTAALHSHSSSQMTHGDALVQLRQFFLMVVKGVAYGYMEVFAKISKDIAKAANRKHLTGSPFFPRPLPSR